MTYSIMICGQSHKTIDYPNISVVVTTYFAGEILKNVLTSISNLDYSKDKIEVIIVATPEDQEAHIYVKEFEKNCSLRIKFVTIKADNVDVQRNYGIKLCKYDYVSVVDDDIILNRNILNKSLDIICSNKKFIASACPAIRDNPSLSEKIHQGKFIGTTATAYTVMPFTFFKKNALLMIGLYREDMGLPKSIHEDWELGSRLSKHGYKIVVDGMTPLRHLEGQTKRKVVISHIIEHSRKIEKTHLVKYIINYAKLYINKNWWSMLQVLKVSPILQLLEYIVYVLLTISLFLVLIINAFYALIFLISIIGITITLSLVRGYYKTYTLKERIAYQLLLLLVRIYRTHLFIIGYLWNIRAYRKKHQ